MELVDYYYFVASLYKCVMMIPKYKSYKIIVPLSSLMLMTLKFNACKLTPLQKVMVKHIGLGG